MLWIRLGGGSLATMGFTIGWSGCVILRNPWIHLFKTPGVGQVHQKSLSALLPKGQKNLAASILVSQWGKKAENKYYYFHHYMPVNPKITLLLEIISSFGMEFSCPMIQTSEGAYLLVKPTNPVLVSSISEGAWAVNC